MKTHHRYFRIPIEKNLGSIDICELDALRQASGKMKVKKSGWWDAKLISQTPTHYMFRCRFAYITEN